jgi:hypothetical protein
MRLICYGIVWVLATGLTACGIGTGIQPSGQDAFKVTEMFSPAEGGAERAQRVALADAARFCEYRGKTFLPVNLPGGGMQGPTDYTVTFRCLAPGVSELQQPDMEKLPDGANGHREQ